MPKQRNITELVSYLQQTRNLFIKGYGLALIEMTQDVEKRAKQNATNQFKGRNGYTLTGRLLNSIFSGFEKRGKGLPIGFVGVRGIPYGAIHEFGGVITPKKAKNLWVKNYHAPKKFKRMTPTEFIDKMKSNPTSDLKGGRETFSIITSKDKKTKIAALVQNYVTRPDKVTALFFLRQKVTIPKRPYLSPAIVDGVTGFHKGINKQITMLIRQNFFGG